VNAIGRWLMVWGLFATAAFLIAPVPGVNEPHYLCKSRAFQDPTWCESDFFLHSSHAHFVFYWLTGWATEKTSLGTIAIVGRLLSVAIVAVGWCRFAASSLIPQRHVVLSAALFALLMLTGSLSGEWLIGGFESKTAAWGFCLIGMASWVDVRHPRRFPDYCLTGVWLGLATCLHPIVGCWVLGGIVMTECWRQFFAARVKSKSTETDQTALPDTSGPVAWVIQMSGLLVSAVTVSLPGVIPALQLVASQSGDHHRQDLANYIQVFNRLKHHLDPTTFPLAAWRWVAVLLGILILTRWPTSRDHAPRKRLPPRLAGLLTAATVVAVCGIAIGWHLVPARQLSGWAWRAALLKFYPFRFFDVLLPAVLAVSVTLRLGESLWLRIEGDDATTTFRPSRSLSLLAVLAVITIGGWSRQSLPSGYTYSAFEDWKVVCDWIKESTPSDALIVTPRESFGFKWFAERPEYVAYKDCPQDVEGLIEWNRRNWVISTWQRRFTADGVINKPELTALAAATGGTWFVTRQPEHVESAIAFQTPTWRVYQLPPSE
jgi:Domain of unknown function (DUF6798)